MLHDVQEQTDEAVDEVLPRAGSARETLLEEATVDFR
jgi:hypothetical protein